jgi:predicted permease
MNLRLAVRTLFRTPFVACVAIASLALGIGANAAIFSLFHQILLQPLPVHEPDRLVNLSSPGPKQGSTSCNHAGSCDGVFSYPMFRDLESADAAFSGVAGHRLFGVNISIDGHSREAEGVFVSGSYFPVLGLRAARGRLFGPQDDETPGAHPVAVLSHAYWETHLGSDSAVIGRGIVVNGQPLTIIGVAPRDFHGTTFGARPVVYIPLTMRAALTPGFTDFENRQDYWLYVFARLHPGATVAGATSAINVAYQPIINDVEAPLQSMTEQRLAEFRAKRIVLEAGRRGQSSTHQEARTPLLLLMATAGLVLIIACANVANLLLARGTERAMEIAVRLSLGARRSQVLRQLLLESVVLAVIGGAAGLVVARWTVLGITMLLPAQAAATISLSLELPVVAFAAALSIVTGLLFGTFPALHSTRAGLVSTIRANAGNVTATRAAARFRSTLATAQVALAMALLITAGLFLRSLNNIAAVELGMRTENVVAFSVSPERGGHDAVRTKQLYEQLESELAALPGVTAVATSMVTLLNGSDWRSNVSVEGYDPAPDTNTDANLNQIGPGFFATFDIGLLAGREFTAADREDRSRVVIVNESFLRKFGLGRDAVGMRMATGRTEELDLEIVGIVRDAKYSGVKEEVPPTFYTPWRQHGRVPSMTFYVRTATDPAQILRAVPGVVAGLDPDLPVQELKTLPQQIRENVFLDRMIGTLSSSFAALATLLAAIGLYGVLAFSVARRTREIGVRMALGADPASVRMLVLRQVGGMLVVGGVVGIATALALGRAAGSILFGLDGSDPLVIAGAATLLSLFALAAGYLPARRAAGIDPIRALRFE